MRNMDTTRAKQIAEQEGVIVGPDIIDEGCQTYFAMQKGEVCLRAIKHTASGRLWRLAELKGDDWQTIVSFKQRGGVIYYGVRAIGRRTGVNK